MRIKVVGYFNTEAMADGHVDPDHPTGLTADGFEYVRLELTLGDLEDLEVAPDTGEG